MIASVAAIIVVLPAYNRAARDPSQTPPILLLYVGAEDCAPCQAWQRHDKLVFQQSEEFRRIAYREVKSPTLLRILNDENWPEDVRKFRDQLDNDAGVP